MDSRDEFRDDLRWAVTPLASMWSKNFDPFKHMKIHGDEKRKKSLVQMNKDKSARMKDFAAVVGKIPKKKK